MRLPLMSKQLVSENQQLRTQLAELQDQTNRHAQIMRRNEQIMRRNQMLDLEFFKAGSFRELFHTLFRILPSISDLDVVSLALFDPEYEIRRILADLDIDLRDFPNILFLQEESEAGEIAGRLKKTILGPYAEHLHGRMFPEPLPAPASIAITPLRRHGKVIGYLSLGSFELGRFTGDMATDFLEHRASIVAICIENVINQELLKHIGTTDPLTGVNNRRYAEQRLLEEIGRSFRHGHQLSCLFIDIDHFKKINDTIGHQAGDHVLREVAARLKAELRLSDTLGRFGGEEFIVLLGETGLNDAARIAQRIRATVADFPLLRELGHNLAVTVSIGVTELDRRSSNESLEKIAQVLVAKADEALYRAKAEGRNRVVTSR